jgi:hypothetical protein
MNGFALAAIGAAFHFAQADKLLGFEDAPEPDYFFATFFYKSHWAAYGALSAFAGTALALRSWPGLIRGNPNAKGRFCLFGAASLLTAMTLALPRSRAGAVLAVLLVIGFLATLLVTLLRSTQVVGRARLLLAAVVAAAALASVGYGVKLDADRGRADFLRTKQQIASAENGGAIDLRVLLSRDTWRMARARPVFGWGLGCFEMVFPLFQGSYLRGPDGLPNARFEFAHDDWLQMAAETGMVGLAVLLLPALAIFRSGWRKGGPAGRWGLAGCGLIALYAWVDFPLNNPAVLVLWTVLLVSAGGMGSGQPEAGQGRASLRVRVLPMARSWARDLTSPYPRFEPVPYWLQSPWFVPPSSCSTKRRNDKANAWFAPPAICLYESPQRMLTPGPLALADSVRLWPNLVNTQVSSNL